ncbi:MAG: hypothetical protein ACXAC2_12615 [Candidatus Kariarchaeaceae archaeon]
MVFNLIILPIGGIWSFSFRKELLSILDILKISFSPYKYPETWVKKNKIESSLMSAEFFYFANEWESEEHQVFKSLNSEQKKEYITKKQEKNREDQR